MGNRRMIALVLLVLILAGCAGGATYQDAYDAAPGTDAQKHDAATAYCLNNPCVWG